MYEICSARHVKRACATRTWRGRGGDGQREAERGEQGVRGEVHDVARCVSCGEYCVSWRGDRGMEACVLPRASSSSLYAPSTTFSRLRAQTTVPYSATAPGRAGAPVRIDTSTGNTAHVRSIAAASACETPSGTRGVRVIRTHSDSLVLACAPVLSLCPMPSARRALPRSARTR